MMTKKKLLSIAVSLLLLSLNSTLTGCSDNDNPIVDNRVEGSAYLNVPNERERDGDASLYAPYVWRLEKLQEDALPKNFRTCQDEFLSYDATDQTGLLDASYHPTRQGFDGLMISGSADFSAKELSQLVTYLRNLHQGNIAILDFRSETHGFVNGAHVSLYGLNNWSNIGKSCEEIIAEEKQRLFELVGKTITWCELSSKTDYQVLEPEDILVETAFTEEERCRAEGVGYKRITVLDHTFPTDQALDSFIKYVCELPPNTWLHFHCQAGKGRTTLFMLFYDMMRNPEIPLQDLVYRHCLIGGNYLLNDGATDNSWKHELYAEKAALVPVFYDYVRSNAVNNFSTSYSEWKNKTFKK